MMGSFNPHYMHKSESGNALAETLMLLQRQKNKAFSGIGDAVEGYGQSRARGKIADLMGGSTLDGMTPEQKQAAIQGATGGRNVGEAGRNTIKELLTSTRDTQDNEWDKEKATTLFGRQMSRQAQGHANSVSLSKMNNSARQKLYGNRTSGNTENSAGNTNPAGNTIKDEYFSLMAKTTDPKERLKIAQEAMLNGVLNKNDRIGLEKLGILNLPESSSQGTRRTNRTQGMSDDKYDYLNSNEASKRGYTKQKDGTYLDNVTGQAINKVWLDKFFNEASR